MMSQNYIGNEWEQILLNQQKELAKAENQLKQEIENQKLRDYFAAKAMQVLIEKSNIETCLIDTVPQAAYVWADAMMKARTK